MIDHQVTGHDWVDTVWVTSHPGHGIPHGSQVDDAGDSREILEDDASRHVGYLTASGGRSAPGGEALDMGLGHDTPPTVSQGILQKNPDGEGESVE
jgi:hypothetical protein